MEASTSAAAGSKSKSTPVASQITEGQQFENFARFKEAIVQWAAVTVEGFKTRYKKSDHEKNVVICAIRGCDFRARA